MVNRKYANITLDLQRDIRNETLEFYISDDETSDFYVKVLRANNPIELNNAIVTLCVIDPKGVSKSQFMEVTDKTGIVYCKLKDSLKSVAGTYQARILVVCQDEKIVTDSFSYTIKDDGLIVLNEEVATDERFHTLVSMLGEFSIIKLDEEQRKLNESNRQLKMTEMEKDIDTLVLTTDEYVKQHIDEVETNVTNLISDTNTKVNDSLSANTTLVNKMISDANETLGNINTNATNTIQSISDYKVGKDSEINNDLLQYKTTTTQSIDSHLEEKDSEFNLSFENYKTTVKNELDLYKIEKDKEIDTYKSTKDLAIDGYLQEKSGLLDSYQNEKNIEIDNYKTAKDGQINTFVSTKNTELNNAEKTRTSNETRRENNEYSRGLNENTRKTNETDRITKFNEMIAQFNNMIKFNENGEMVVTLNGVSKTFVPKQ